MSKNIKQLESFIKYCQENPHQRFWQALRNWSGCNFIYSQKKGGLLSGDTVDIDGDYIELEDTYYKE